MELLATKESLKSTLENLLANCKSTSWAVAWARRTAPGFQSLKEHKGKIKDLIIGTHFFQTDPGFISAFRNVPGVQFVRNTGGVFHPKVYLFEREGNQWDAIVGSPNFTGAAFSENKEVAVLINSGDVGADKVLVDIREMFRECRLNSEVISREKLKAYKEKYRKRTKHIKYLKGGWAESPNKKWIKARRWRNPPNRNDMSILNMSWGEFKQEVKEEEDNGRHAIRDRLRVLERSAELFENCKGRFASLSEDDRLCIAGIHQGRDEVIGGKMKHVSWGYFGFIVPVYLSPHIRNRSSSVVSSLNKIPWDRRVQVERHHFENFVEEFTKGDKPPITRDQPSITWIAAATRLLAMKRPDTFVCVNGKNKKTLSEKFDFYRKVALDLKNYWELIIEPMRESKWWSVEEPMKRDLKIWQGRAALMDAFCYDND